MKTIAEWIDGNPALKAFLYFTMPVLAVMAERFSEWEHQPPDTWFGYAAGAMIALGAGFTALKALMSNPKGTTPKPGNNA